MTHVLDNPVWSTLTGPRPGPSEVVGRAARFLPEVSLFAGLSDPADPAAWADLADLVGPSGSVLLAAPVLGPVPPGWVRTAGLPAVQMVAGPVETRPDPEAVELTAADLPEMLDLVERTRPGPFAARTVELGGYLGIRRDGRLVAMAGERLHPPGYGEISAVCTDPAHRGQGLAARLTRAVADGIRRRGETPVLHAAERNTGAIKLYEYLGFTVRTTLDFSAFDAPPGPGGTVS